MAAICENRLLSCHYQASAHTWLKVARHDPLAKTREIMLDSGAFSAWSKGDTVTREELVRKYDELLEAYASDFKAFHLINLDVIPGERGRNATPEEMDEALRLSDVNFEELNKRYGDIVLPVFHQGEPIDRLQEVVQQNPSYICVSPRNDLSEIYRREWAQMVHANVSRDVMTHGLATTGALMMSRVPWGSVDSATWVMIAAMGQVSLYANGRLRNITISRESPDKPNLGKHFDSFVPEQKAAVVALVEEVGATIQEVSENAAVRCWVNLYHMTKMSKDVKVKELTAQPTLF